LINPDTIVARLFKAKYFPHGDLLTAELGHNPSYVWRSLWTSRSVIEKGYRWKIWNGQHIPVWSTPWLKEDGKLCLETPVNANWPDLVVADLVLPYTQDWNTPLITSLFSTRDVSQILSLPVCVATGTDRRIWHYSKNGQYTVKSAYHVYMEQIVNRTSHNQQGEWRKLWQVDVPTKIKHFAWRLPHKVLPTRGRLRQRGMDVRGLCGICGKDYEEDWHVFLTCPWSQSGWNHLGIRDIINRTSDTMLELEDWLWTILNTCSKAECATILHVYGEFGGREITRSGQILPGPQAW
ncbi:Putative ribonuclease H protein At1g65750, partial [Linum grandiflorum]